MKKLCSLLLIAVAVVSGCTNPGSTSSTPPSTVKTLYYGDWGWAAVNANNVNDYVTGISAFSIEIINNNSSSPQMGKKIAGGWYDVNGISIKPAGMALMGAIVTSLDVGFSVGSTSQVLMVGSDSDGIMGIGTSGRRTFSGMGRVYGSSGTYIDVAIALVHRDDSPTYSQIVENSLLSSIASASQTKGELGASFAQKDAQAIAEKLATSVVVKQGQGDLYNLFK